MWVPIFMQNKDNVLDVTRMDHISQLRKFKSCLEKENFRVFEGDFNSTKQMGCEEDLEIA
jgi:hypothetical protein